MKITADLSDLWKEVRKITSDTADFSLDSSRRGVEPIDIELDEGKEVAFGDIDFTGLLAAVNGRQVLLYIADHSFNFNDVVSGQKDGNKFHVTDCKTLEMMRRDRRFERYIVTNSLSGRFRIFGKGRFDSQKAEAEVSLLVCKNCLIRLNYKGAEEYSIRQSVVDSFSIPEFFETYSSCFRYEPKSFRGREEGYVTGWSEISSQLKKDKGYRCETCRVILRDHKRLLHVHHINGVKSDNSPGNLKVLCMDCHRKEPKHSHMHIKHADMKMLTRLRKEQSLIKDDWVEALELCDPAVRGALEIFRKKGLAAPEIGYEFLDSNSAVIGEVEAAWAAKRLAIVINESMKFKVPGWTMKSLAEIHV